MWRLIKIIGAALQNAVIVRRGWPDRAGVVSLKPAVELGGGEAAT